LPSTKRQQQKEDTKKRIVQVAYQVYAKRGFTATTNDIARETGVSHGTIFAHFQTKDDLIIYLLEDFGERTNARLHDLTEESNSMKDVLNAHLNAILEEEDFYIRVISETYLLPEAVRSVFIGVQSTIAFHLVKMIQKEKHMHALKDLPDHFIFNLWTGLLHYYLQNKVLFAPDSSVIERYREDFVTNFLEVMKETKK
jgi:AcrR family transcriptional regulator